MKVKIKRKQTISFMRLEANNLTLLSNEQRHAINGGHGMGGNSSWCIDFPSSEHHSSTQMDSAGSLGSDLAGYGETIAKPFVSAYKSIEGGIESGVSAVWSGIKKIF